jgi:glycosyltransferase involved in cell wall biosynthesis
MGEGSTHRSRSIDGADDVTQALTVLHVNTSDRGGGAEMVATMLQKGERGRGLNSRLAVGWTDSRDSQVAHVDNDSYRSDWARTWISIVRRITDTGPGLPLSGRPGAISLAVGEPLRFMSKVRGWEDFNHPATSHLMSILERPPDLIHLHNLHGSYFDLRELAPLSNRVPVAITMHDQWLFTGHCAYTFDCQRWEIGCGSCPYLKTYPAIFRDRSAQNLARKRNVYARSRLFVSAPTEWLLRQAERSVLSEGIAESRLIRNGIDLSVFKPGDRFAARQRLGLPTDVPVVVFIANKARDNPFKDWRTAEEAIRVVGERTGILAVCVGSPGETDRYGSTEIRYVPHQEPEVIADCYRAADLYLHSARADNSPLTVLEAQACGVPVVASAVGGIPEIVRPLMLDGQPVTDVPHFTPEHATGVLARMGDATSFADAMSLLLSSPDLGSHLGFNAARWVKEHFDFERYLDDTIDWYHMILSLK